MRRLLASDLLPQRAGQPVKALVHIYFAELRDRDQDGILQDKWITEYRARWAAHRAAASVSTGDGGAWLEGDAAREVACDAMIIPVVTGDIDPGAVEDLIAAVRPVPPAPHPALTRRPRRRGSRRHRRPGRSSRSRLAAWPAAAARRAEVTAAAADALAELEHQILAKILQVVSGPGGAASFLRRHLLGKPLAGPSLPLDVGQTDDIPLHLRRLVALRDQTCQYPGGCDQPASGCEPHHVSPPLRRRPHQPHQPQRLLLVAPPRRPARTRLDPDRPPRRHQPGPKPRRQDHPQPQPPTPPRVTTPPGTTATPPLSASGLRSAWAATMSVRRWRAPLGRGQDRVHLR